MTTYFFDSSALVKNYIRETGTNWVRSVIVPSAGNRIIIARVTPVEVISAISRLKRETRITSRTAHAARLLLDRHVHRQYAVVELSRTIVERAEDLLDRHVLRAYDAVQLVSALESNARMTMAGFPALTFVCADHRLLGAAAIEGLQTDNPVAHP